MYFRLLGLLFTVFIIGCSSDADPEATARRWQELVDSNKFKEAKELSTDRASDMIDMIETIVAEDDGEDAIISETKYEYMQCTENGNRAVCKYAIIENMETVVDSFLLAKVGRKWLVDVPERDELLETDEVDKMFNDYENKLNQELK